MSADLTRSDLSKYSARKLAKLIAGRDLSAVELIDLTLQHANAVEPTVNAYVRLLDDEAREIASERDREARAGNLRGPLHGVPIAVKDNFAVVGHPTRKGSRTTPDTPAKFNSPVVERMVAAGAVIIGLTTTPEFGWKGTGISPLTGVTRNPWNPERASGGSSAGSAVTVASGVVPIALGSDAGGSIRIPASFCGVVGLKPTLGRIPVYPGTVTHTVSHAGPLGLTIDDARLALEVSGGPDPRDPLSYNATRVHSSERASRAQSGRCRVAIVRTPFACRSDPEVAAAFETTMERVTSGIAAEYYDHDLDLELPRRIFETIWVAGRGLGFRDAFKAHAELMDPGLVRLGALAEKITLATFFEVDQARRAFTSSMFALLEQFDLLLMPTMPMVAFQAEAETPEAGDLIAPLPWVTWTPYTYPFNLTGQPAVSLPCGVTVEGLPVGLQVVGPWGEDELVLDFAEQIEQTIGFARSHHAPSALRRPGQRTETRLTETATLQTHQASSVEG